MKTNILKAPSVFGLLIAATVIAWLSYAWIPIYKSYVPKIEYEYMSKSENLDSVQAVHVSSVMFRYKGLYPSGRIYGDFDQGIFSGTYTVQIDFAGRESREVRLSNRPYSRMFSIKNEALSDKLWRFSLFHDEKRVISVLYDPEKVESWQLITED